MNVNKYFFIYIASAVFLILNVEQISAGGINLAINNTKPFGANDYWDSFQQNQMKKQQKLVELQEFIARSMVSCATKNLNGNKKIAIVVTLDDTIAFEDVEGHWESLEIFHGKVLEIFAKTGWRLMSEEEENNGDEIAAIFAVSFLPAGADIKITSLILGIENNKEVKKEISQNFSKTYIQSLIKDFEQKIK